MGYFPRSKIQKAIDAALSDDRLEEYTAGDVEHAWQNMDRCLARMDDDEPIFVLRAQDKTAVRAIRFWLDRLNDQGVALTPDHKDEVYAVIDQFESWQEAHPDRVKMPD